MKVTVMLAGGFSTASTGVSSTSHILGEVGGDSVDAKNEVLVGDKSSLTPSWTSGGGSSKVTTGISNTSKRRGDGGEDSVDAKNEVLVDDKSSSTPNWTSAEKCTCQGVLSIRPVVQERKNSQPGITKIGVFLKYGENPFQVLSYPEFKNGVP
jgi:hypothetical protein